MYSLAFDVITKLLPKISVYLSSTYLGRTFVRYWEKKRILMASSSAWDRLFWCCCLYVNFFLLLHSSKKYELLCL